MYGSRYPRTLLEKEVDAINRVIRAGKRIDYHEVHNAILKNQMKNQIDKPVFEAIYKYYF